MGGYVPNTKAQQQQMLKAIGHSSFDDLYQVIPESMRVKSLNLEPGKSELEVRRIMEGLAAENKPFKSIFRGAGSYDHYIPSVVKSVTSKESFLTAYTPYQAEISQGVLQSIFEYQTMICELTGMDVSNASVYDGPVAAAEAVLMCETRKRSRVVLSGALHPHVIEVVKTYCDARSVDVTVVPPKGGKTDIEGVKTALKDDAACLCFQQPGYYGIIEDAEALCVLAHEAGAKAVMSVNPIAMSLLKSPAECGADVAVGEGQPLGIAMGFGGPYLGFMATTQRMMRQLPGRIVGKTTDSRGGRAFVLTLQAREQHIRREKASSNICSNQALCAMTASVYLAAMGPGGLEACATQCHSKAVYAMEQLTSIKGVSLCYDEPFFHEFVTTCPVDPEMLNRRLEEEGILGGLPVDEGLLWCVTEKQSKEDIDRMVAVVREVCEL